MVRLKAQVTLLGLLTASLLGSCNPVVTRRQAEESAPSAATQPSDVETSDAEYQLANTPPDSPATGFSRPKRQCYQLDNDRLTTNLRLTIDYQRQSIQGDARSLVQNDEAGNYAQSFSGKLAGNQGKLRVFTWSEHDFQADDETWSFTDDTLAIGKDVLNLTDCQLVSQAFQDFNGLEASDLLDDINTGLTESVRFAPGTSSMTLSNSVLQGKQNVYYLRVDGGEQMSLSIKSLENNAVFDVISPSRYILANKAKEETILLPHPGDHMVIVGGSRENATTYELTIGIESAAAQ
ncbi:hypothetical protein Lepto7375DRAFT_5021 [Leptolyngbya sp. PCC 7375]|nr:hypothetical protein Lepto7375DRAFT_5021 [Leptolyngbya sp. PCC 7375]